MWAKGLEASVALQWFAKQTMRGAPYPTISGETWCFLRISAIHWPAAHVYMRERQCRLSQDS